MKKKPEVEFGAYYPRSAMKLEIKPVDEQFGGHRVYLDGTEIRGVKNLTLEMGNDMVNTLWLNMYVGEVAATVVNTTVEEGRG